MRVYCVIPVPDPHRACFMLCFIAPVSPRRTLFPRAWDGLGRDNLEWRRGDGKSPSRSLRCSCPSSFCFPSATQTHTRKKLPCHPRLLPVPVTCTTRAQLEPLGRDRYCFGTKGSLRVRCRPCPSRHIYPSV